MRGVTALRVAALAAIAVLLAACSGIPTTGPVRPGDSGVATPNPVLPILQGPQPGDDPRAIVQGFLTASAGGVVTGFDVAREYLTPEAAVAWDPLAKVTIFDSRQVTPTVNEETLIVTYSLPVAAMLDDSGVMTESAPEVRQDHDFHVVLTESGEFRIAELDDGIIISEANFARSYRQVELAFASTDIAYVVPDLRWFPSNEQIATAAARELIEGPVPWLADAVVTGFPATSSLAVDAVVVQDGIAHVPLAPGSAGNPDERALAAEQMTLTLARQIASIASANTTVGGVSLTSQAEPWLTRTLVPEQVAVVAAGGRLGVWDGTTITVTPDEMGALPEGARSLAMDYDLTTAAFVTAEGLWVTSAPSLRETFIPYAPQADAPEGVLDARLVRSGSTLVAPSFDRFGWLWTADQAPSGALIVVPPGGDEESAFTLEAAWLSGRSVQAIALSRDGARAAILTRIGAQQTVEIVAVVRDAAGTPISLGQPLGIAPSVRPSVDIGWSDASNLVILGEESGDVTIATVGGRTSDIAAVTGAVSFSVRYGDRTLVTITDHDELQVRSGNSWAPQHTGVTDVAFPG